MTWSLLSKLLGSHHSKNFSQLEPLGATIGATSTSWDPTKPVRHALWVRTNKTERGWGDLREGRSREENVGSERPCADGRYPIYLIYVPVLKSHFLIKLLFQFMANFEWNTLILYIHDEKKLVQSWIPCCQMQNIMNTFKFLFVLCNFNHASLIYTFLHE